MIGSHPEQLDRPVCDRETIRKEKRKKIELTKIPLASFSYMYTCGGRSKCTRTTENYMYTQGAI